MTQLQPATHDELALLLGTAAGQLYQSADPDRFLEWIAEAGPVLAPAMAAQIDPATGPVSQFFRLLGVNIYNITPLEEHGFTLRPLPKPQRNEPCFCGSGRKYKQCCIDIEDLPMLGHYNMLRHVLDHCSQKALAALPGTRVDAEAVADTAAQWLDEGETTRALALLEPWFKSGQPLKRRHLPLFDLLMDLYLYEQKPIKRKRLLERACNADDKQLRAIAHQRKATILLDAGDIDGAWDAFTTAQRLDPGSPALALLEITLLCATGEIEQAKQRATFSLARFRRNGDLPPDFLALLEACTEDPEAALSMALPSDPLPEGVDELIGMLEAAPDPAAHYTLERYDNEAMLEPKSGMRKLEARWDKLTRGAKPALVHTQTGDPAIWENAAQWLSLLQRESKLWHSFQVLDDLVMGVDALHMEDLDAVLLEPLLDRAVALLICNLEQATAAGECTLPWLMLENRPALRLLAHSAFHQVHVLGGATATFIQRAELLMRLNPNDNHGIRDALSTAYIAHDQLDKAIALTEQFPDDMLCAIPLNHILALYLDKRKGEALARLAEVRDRIPVAITMLLADNPEPPEFSEYGISLGGEDEAWLYRESTLPLWRQDGALDWLRQAVASIKSKGPHQ